MARRRGYGSSTTRQAQAPRKQRGWFMRWLRRLFAFGLVASLIGAIGLFTAVYFAAREMPSFSELKSSQHGQTILVRARDGSGDRPAWPELWPVAFG